MRSVIPKDYYGGALIMLIGLVSAYGGSRFQIGTLQRMGPGFFPTAIGVVLAAIGLMIALSAGPAEADAKTKPPLDLRGALCIVGGLLAFAVLGDFGGLIPATFAVVFISAMGDRQNTVKTAAMLATGVVVTGVFLFWWLLQIQLPLFGSR